MQCNLDLKADGGFGTFTIRGTVHIHQESDTGSMHNETSSDLLIPEPVPPPAAVPPPTQEDDVKAILHQLLQAIHALQPQPQTQVPPPPQAQPPSPPQSQPQPPTEKPSKKKDNTEAPTPRYVQYTTPSTKRKSSLATIISHLT